MTHARPRGRRPKELGDTRAKILLVAGGLFAKTGLDQTSLRLIAREAEVDPSLVLHYFGSKERLFFESVQQSMQRHFDLTFEGPTDLTRIGERMVDVFLAHWDAADGGATFAAVFRAAMTNERAAQMLREFIQTEIPRKLAVRVPGMATSYRVGLVATQLMGLAVARYVARLEPVVTASREELAASVGPTLTRYLTASTP